MILSEADLEHWRTQGFVVARGVISAKQAARTADEVYEFAGRQAHADHKWHIPSRGGGYADGDTAADSRRGYVEMYHGEYSRGRWSH
jgi:hypothetical protein